MPGKALPIRHILLAAFLFAGLLPTILTAGLAFFEARSALKTEIQHDMQMRAAAAAEEIDHMVFERLQNVISWSRLEVMQDVRIGDIDKRLSNFLSELKTGYQGVYVNLYALDKHGHIVAASSPELIGQQAMAPHPWLAATLLDTKVTLGKISNSRLPISATIPDTLEGESLGILVATFDWQQITRVLQQNSASSSAAALFDAGNSMIASTPRWTEIESGKRLSGRASAYGYQDFPGFGWSIKIVQPRKEAMAPIRRMGYIFAGILVSTLLLASFIAVPVATSITRPLARLTDFANGFIRAPGNTMPPIGGPAEVNGMATAFGKMINDLEQSRENLTRAAKLAVVGEMAAAMSHEVRTPLGILRSSAQLLLREPSLSEEGREVCGFIISETERLNKLVSTLIDSARPRQPEFLPVNISELAQQAAAMLRIQAQKKNIRLECKADIPVTVPCDAEQITQVLLNLLLNAIQILPESGQILLSVSQSPEHALISVADNGPGIAPDEQEHVFDPFFTQREGGIGLGLAVVRQIAAAHQGEISVGTSAMHGAEFSLKLPLNRASFE